MWRCQSWFSWLTWREMRLQRQELSSIENCTKSSRTEMRSMQYRPKAWGIWQALLKAKGTISTTCLQDWSVAKHLLIWTTVAGMSKICCFWYGSRAFSSFARLPKLLVWVTQARRQFNVIRIIKGGLQRLRAANQITQRCPGGLPMFEFRPTRTLICRI